MQRLQSLSITVSVFPLHQSSQSHGNFKFHHNPTCCIAWTIFVWGTSDSTWSTKKREGKKGTFLSTDCSGLQEDLGLSNSKTEVLLRDIKFGVSFTFITEKNSFAKIQQNNHQLGSFFELRKLVYRCEDKDTKIAKNVELPIVVYSQLPALIETILQKQQRDRQSV